MLNENIFNMYLIEHPRERLFFIGISFTFIVDTNNVDNLIDATITVYY